MRIPRYVRDIHRQLHRHGFEAYPVGGAVRDSLLGIKPQDWDMASNASPEEMEKIFPKTIPTGKAFGTLTVVQNGHHVQITTFRQEGGYQDHRKPRSVAFISDLKQDLSRRDFTINAMAWDIKTRKLIDPFGGQTDLRKKRLVTVGNAQKRLQEDHLRLVRAGRFMAQLDVKPNRALTQAATRIQGKLKTVSAERIRDELSKLLLSAHPAQGLRWLDKVGVLSLILPEIREGKGVRQGGWHRHDVFTHTLKSIDLSPRDLTLRLALLLHDVAKPRCRVKEGRRYHFYGHERLGTEMAHDILKRLRYPKALQKAVQTLVRHHLFEAGSIAQNPRAVRRLIQRVGDPQMDLLLALREADAEACGPGRSSKREIAALRRTLRDIRQARDAFSLRDLAVDGKDVMKVLHLKAGPHVGFILRALLEEVMRDPSLNRKDILRHLMGSINATR